MTTLLLSFLLATNLPASTQWTKVETPLPKAGGFVSLDYFAAERAAGRIWIPAGNTGCVDVLDVATRKITCIEGFAVAERERHGKMRKLGPSAVSLGDGRAFVGNRASSELCAVDTHKLVKTGCAALTAVSDGVQYVAATKEVWVTTPGDASITIVDASDGDRPRQKARIALPGEPEGYAVDEAGGLFFTNLEDKDKTLVIDVRSRKVVHTWSPRCGPNGPRGLAYDGRRRFLFVACTDRALVLDAAHGGALLSTLETGAGVDNIDYLDTRQTLYVAAGKAARLTVAHVDARGTLKELATVPTAEGGRVVVVAGDGTAIVGDPEHGGVLMVAPPH
jgi:hypothetical protein